MKDVQVGNIIVFGPLSYMLGSTDPELRHRFGVRNPPCVERLHTDRHDYTINVCFMDGAVDRVRLKRLWDLKWHKEYSLADPPPTGPTGWPRCPIDDDGEASLDRGLRMRSGAGRRIFLREIPDRA